MFSLGVYKTPKCSQCSGSTMWRGLCRLRGTGACSKVRARCARAGIGGVGVWMSTPEGIAPSRLEARVSIPPQHLHFPAALNACEQVACRSISATEETWLSKVWRFLVRTVRRGRVLLCSAAAGISLWVGLNTSSDVIRSACWSSISSSLQWGGVTLIKLGQWMSQRPDLFPPSLCTQLADLRDDAPVRSDSRRVALLTS